MQFSGLILAFALSAFAGQLYCVAATSPYAFSAAYAFLRGNFRGNIGMLFQLAFPRGATHAEIL